MIEKNNLKYVKIKNKCKIIISEKLVRELIRRIHEKYGHIDSKHVRNISSPYYHFKGIEILIKYALDAKFVYETKLGLD